MGWSNYSLRSDNSVHKIYELACLAGGQWFHCKGGAGERKVETHERDRCVMGFWQLQTHTDDIAELCRLWILECCFIFGQLFTPFSEINFVSIDFVEWKFVLFWFVSLCVLKFLHLQKKKMYLRLQKGGRGCMLVIIPLLLIKGTQGRPSTSDKQVSLWIAGGRALLQVEDCPTESVEKLRGEVEDECLDPFLFQAKLEGLDNQFVNLFCNSFEDWLCVDQIQVDLLCGPGKLISCSCHLNTINFNSDAINSTNTTNTINSIKTINSTRDGIFLFNSTITSEGSSLAGCFFCNLISSHANVCRSLLLLLHPSFSWPASCHQGGVLQGRGGGGWINFFLLEIKLHQSSLPSPPY